MQFLDNFPLATAISLVSIVLVVIYAISNGLHTYGELQDALLALGGILGGAGIVGIARAQSGRGIKPPR